MNVLNSRTARVVAVVVVQLVIVGLTVAGQLSARLTGEEYTFRVAPVDPHDPFRGAYVDLSYPDLPPQSDRGGPSLGDDSVDLFIPLEKAGEVWKGGVVTRDRPEDSPYLACQGSDWQYECGIESWFLPQDKAKALEDAIRDGEVVARVKIDGRGNAALVAVETR